MANGVMRAWDGTQWVSLPAAAPNPGSIAQAINVNFAPAGNISSTNVQAAIEELDSEKAKLNGDAAQAFAASNYTTVVASIAALKALDKTRFFNAFVNGYYAAGDGGGGRYYLDAADTTTADNAGTVIEAFDGGRWKLVQQEYVSIKQFGAKGDGSTDDAAVINNAINVSPTGTTLRIPRGTYRVSTTINVKGGITLVGESRDSTTTDFNCAIRGDAAVTPVVKTLVGNTSPATLKNFSITRNLGGTPGTTLVGLETTATDQQVVEDINIWNHGIGLYVHGQLAPYFHRVNTWKISGYHVKIQATVEPTFYKCRFGRNGGADIAASGYVNIDGSTGISVDTVSFERCQFNQSGAVVGVIVQFTSYVNPNGIINFIGCHAEGWGSGGIAADAPSTRVQRIKIVGSTFHQAGVGLQFFVGAASIFDELIISGSSFDSNVTLDGLNTVSVSGSIFTGSSFLINGGTGAITGNTISMPLTVVGTFDHFTITGNALPAGFSFGGASGTFISAGNI